MQALSGVDSALKKNNLLENTAVQSALETQFLLQIGVFTAVPMIVNFILEQGVLRVRYLYRFFIKPLYTDLLLQHLYADIVIHSLYNEADLLTFVLALCGI